MSEYQAAWIVDSDVEEDDEEDADKENRVDFKIDTPEADDVAMEDDEEDAEGDDGISGGGGKRKVRFGDEADFEDLSQDEEDAQLASWRLAREKNKEREKEGMFLCPIINTRKSPMNAYDLLPLQNKRTRCSLTKLTPLNTFPLNNVSRGIVV